ncbi:SDR family oxidoreductase [Leifsonia sp. H3M29-4]|uniref:SDR family NAD(P)-dependent oxidoreductase n=1 Tax=Salinibacterium metalliresistens TaxID=3031321 RepID=UPI0023DA220D|nr:SDR family oxidoreductase [Salinibacterium metalliresistens]MDF1478153.1 SDR family oxidoreductase [Salinibacterium metalliresistens]
MTGRALVTGATSSLGAAVLRALDSAGYRSVGTSLDEAGIGGVVEYVAADLSAPGEAARVLDRAMAVLGGLDTVVCIAGAMPVARIEDTTDEQLAAAMSGSFSTFFETARAAVTRMPPGSSIVAVSSVNATLAAPGVAAYASAKGAVEALVRQLALDQAARGIRVNAVAPGLIDSGTIADGGAGYPRGRAVTDDEVAAAIVFLALPGSSGITGAVLPVDAGLSITSPASFLRPDLRQRLTPADRAD